MDSDRHAAVMVTLSRPLSNCYAWLFVYQCIADSIIINCLIVIDGINDFVMLFHWMCRALGFPKSGISLECFAFSSLVVFLSATECHGQVSDRKSGIYLRLLLALQSNLGF